MRAVALTEFGSTPKIVDITIPEPSEVAGGNLKGVIEHRFPVVLGKDFAGVVDSVGPGVTGYAAGDRVFGVVTKPFLGDGSFGEYVTVPVTVGLAKLPETVSFTEAAGLGLAGTAAFD